MKNIFYLFLISALLFSCASEKDEATFDSNQEAENNLPDGHPPISGLQALGELSEDDGEFIQTNDPTLQISNLTFTCPDDWQREKPSSPVRIAQFKIKNHPDVNIAVFFFGEQDLEEDNIAMWKREFEDLKSDKIEELAGGKIKFLNLEGTYNIKAFPMAQEYTTVQDYTVLAAIVKSNDGPYYFKTYAPTNILSSEIENFREFLNSCKFK